MTLFYDRCSTDTKTALVETFHDSKMSRQICRTIDLPCFVKLERVYYVSNNRKMYAFSRQILD